MCRSAGLRILIGTVVFFTVLLLLIFVFPIGRWLHLSISTSQAQWTLYLFGMQIVASMLLGFFKGNYVVVGKAHRGENLSNVWQLAVTIGTAGLVLLHASFRELAAVQLAITLTTASLMIVDLWILAPDIRPTIRYWEEGSLMRTLRPSGHYALLYSSNILAYQLPIIVMQRFLGPAAVVVFSVTRTVYSMSRRLPYLVTNAIGPEITITYGQKDWPRLTRIYELSERVVLLLVPPTTFGAMLFTPFLLIVWLHRGTLYMPYVSILMGVTIAIQSVKEHKYQFQFSSNQIRAMSYMTPAAYGLMLLASIPMMHVYGLVGFLVVWPLSELAQFLYLLRLNQKLFYGHASLDLKPVYVLFAALVVGSIALAWPLIHIVRLSLFGQAMTATILTLVVTAVSYWLFQIDEIRDILWKRFATSYPAVAKRFI